MPPPLLSKGPGRKVLKRLAKEGGGWNFARLFTSRFRKALTFAEKAFMPSLPLPLLLLLPPPPFWEEEPPLLVVGVFDASACSHGGTPKVYSITLSSIRMFSLMYSLSCSVRPSSL